MPAVGFFKRVDLARDQLPLRGVTDRSDDRRTPYSLYHPLATEYGFTLDAAATAENAKCARWFSPAEDGLVESWAGERVWCNPPYTHLAPWVAKAWIEHETAPVIVMLVPSTRTEQKWWQEMVEPHRDGRGPIETRFIPGRVEFGCPEGAKAGGAPFGCVLLIWNARSRLT